VVSALFTWQSPKKDSAVSALERNETDRKVCFWRFILSGHYNKSSRFYSAFTDRTPTIFCWAKRVWMYSGGQ
jgi:hypothetical protein